MNILMMDDSEILGTEEIDVSAVEGELMIDESAQIDAELQELEIAIQVTGEQAEEAEQLHDEVAATVEDGGEGLTQQSAVFVHRSLATLAAINGQKGHTYFTVQSFAVAGDSRQVTLQALDTIKSFIKRYWEKLKAFLRKWYLKVGEFYDKHGSKAGRMAKAFDALLKKVNAKSGKPKETKIKIPPTKYQHLVINSKSDINDVAKNLKVLHDRVRNAPSIGKTALADYKDELGKLDSGKLSNTDAVRLASKFNGAVLAFTGVKAEQLMAGKPVSGESVYIGGYSLVVQATTKRIGQDEQVEIITGYNFSTKAVGEDLRISDDDEVPALTRQQLTDLIIEGSALCKSIYKGSGELREQTKNLNTALEKGDKTIERLAKEKDGVRTGDDSTVGAIAVITAGVRGGVAITRLFLKQATVTAGAIYSYCSASYSNLTTEA